jgi:hypothetical protein
VVFELPYSVAALVASRLGSTEKLAKADEGVFVRPAVRAAESVEKLRCCGLEVAGTAEDGQSRSDGLGCGDVERVGFIVEEAGKPVGGGSHVG